MVQKFKRPGRFCSPGNTAPLLETEVLQEGYQVRKEPPGRAESVMIVIAPAQTKKILSPFLDPAGPVLELPVDAFFGKKQFTGYIRTHSIDCLPLQGKRLADSIFIVWEIPFSASPELAYGDDLGSEPWNFLSLNEVPVSESLNGNKSSPGLSANDDLA